MAISNQRLVGLEGDDVLFRYKDRAAEERWIVLRLHAHEFLRRFLFHVLPGRFVRIRYFGLLAQRHRRRLLNRCREHLGGTVATAVEPMIESWSQRLLHLTGFDALRCPFCILSSLASPAGATPRGPP